MHENLKAILRKLNILKDKDNSVQDPEKTNPEKLIYDQFLEKKECYLKIYKYPIINVMSIIFRILIIFQVFFFLDKELYCSFAYIFGGDIALMLIIIFIFYKSKINFRYFTIFNSTFFLLDLIPILVIFCGKEINNENTSLFTCLIYVIIISKNIDYFYKFPQKNFIIVSKHVSLIICLILSLVYNVMKFQFFLNALFLEVAFNYGLIFLKGKKKIKINSIFSVKKDKDIIDINEILFNLNIIYVSYNKNNIKFQSKIPKIFEKNTANTLRKNNSLGKIFQNEFENLSTRFILKQFNIKLKDILEVMLVEKKKNIPKPKRFFSSLIDESKEMSRLCVSEAQFSFNIHSFLINKKIIQKNNEGNLEVIDTKNKFNFLGEFWFEDGIFIVSYKKEKENFELIISESHKKEIELKTVIMEKPDRTFEKKIKQNILSKIAHELKTPVNSILGFVRNLMQGTSDLEMRKELINIHSISNVVNFLIKDLIFYSNIEKIDTNLNYSSISIKETMFNSNLNAFMLYDTLNALLSCYGSKMKYIKSHLILDKTFRNYEIVIDDVMINQIVINFLSNSVKFTRKGHIYIMNSFISKSKNSIEEHFLKISIIDTGNGISERNLEFLFNEEIRTNINGEYNNQGSKIGLSICLNLAKFLNVKIEYYSEENMGSIFSLLIPAKKVRSNLDETIIRKSNFTKSKSFENVKNALADIPQISDNCSKSEISENREHIKMNARLLSEFEFIEPEIQFRRMETDIADTYSEFKLSERILFDKVKEIRKSNKKNRDKEKSAAKILELSNNDINNNDDKNLIYYCSNEDYIWKYNYIEHDLRNCNDNSSIFQSIDINKSIENKANINNCNNSLNYNCINNNNNERKYKKEINSMNIKVQLTKSIDFLDINESINTNTNNNENIEKLNVSRRSISCLSEKESEVSLAKLESFEESFVSNNKIENTESFGPKISNRKCLQKNYKNKIPNNNQDDILNIKELHTRNNLQIMDKISENGNIKYCTICDKRICECNVDNIKPKKKNSLLSVDEKIIIKSDRGRCSSRRSDNLQNSKSYDDSFVFLIIEDNINISEIQKNLLRIVLENMKKTQNLDFDYKILVGEDGIDALKFVIDPLLSTRIKGIFTDENMEFMNGSESIKIIRNLQKLNKISHFNICTVTAFEDKATAMGIKFNGVDKILKKPLNKSQLEEYFVKFPFMKIK